MRAKSPLRESALCVQRLLFSAHKQCQATQMKAELRGKIKMRHSVERTKGAAFYG